MSQREWIREAGEEHYVESPATNWVVRRVDPALEGTACGGCSGVFRGAVWGACHRGVPLGNRFCSMRCGRAAVGDAEAEYQKRQLVNAIMEG